MLPYFLAIAIAAGSFSFYMAAFFVPEIHRRQDFLWSGVGMFYALVLWFCAGRITGAVLLGQAASVALLGWLGWQTLSLRRELTPTSVRTNASWADLQQWLALTRRTLGKYLQTPSLWAGIRAAGNDVAAAIATIRARIAGPKGQPPPASDVPPLRRAPAYEFETETGQGEAVPSEFATIAARRSQPKPTDQPLAETTPVSASEPASTASSSDADSGIAADAVAPPPTTVASAPKPLRAVPLANSEEKVSEQEEAAPASTNQPPPSKPVKKRVAAKAAPGAVAQSEKSAGSANWLGSLVRGFRKPKPKRAAIEIPPRPPSIPRTPDPSTPQTSSQGDDTNWVDVGGASEPNQPGQQSPPPNAGFTPPPVTASVNSARPDANKPEPLDNESTTQPRPGGRTEIAQSSDLETNWPEETVTEGIESQNWPEEGDTAPAVAELDDESESNWPD